MTENKVETILTDELHKIAPDISLSEIDRGADLREELDIDSIDFLRLVAALGERFGLPMPEADYSKMESFDALAGYLQTKSS